MHFYVKDHLGSNRLVVDSNGNTLDDFNGNVDLILFDAEMPVETYGNGDEGEPYTYNDRQSRLFRSVEKVTGGTAEQLEDSAWLIRAEKSEVTITLGAADHRYYYEKGAKNK